MIDRRAFILAATGGLLAAPLAARAETGKVARIGLLDHSAPDPSRLGWWQGFKGRLRELGYVEGQNVVFEPRWAQEDAGRLPDLAADLVRLNVHVIVTAGSAAAPAASRATTTIPIVQASGADLVAVGVAASLARPGGNVTGVTSQTSELGGKRLELIRELIPRVSRVAVVWDLDNPGSAIGLRDIKEAVPRTLRIALLAPADPDFSRQVQEAQKAALPLGVKLIVVQVRDSDYDRAFATIAADRPDALFVGANAQFFLDRNRIIELAAKHRLPAIYEWPEHVEDGGLMAYGTSLAGLSRRAAVYIDRIFKGAKPADLPIEQPARFELVINLRTAKTLGLTIPPSLLQRADQVIE